MDRERIPEHNFAIPNVVDYALNDPLAQKPLRTCNSCNFQRVQPKESRVSRGIVILRIFSLSTQIGPTSLVRGALFAEL
jgi:hypothetical protein